MNALLFTSGTVTVGHLKALRLNSEYSDISSFLRVATVNVVNNQ